MSIPYLPGFGDELRSVLPELGQNLARLINPNMDRENALKDAITKDPSILQQLANMESVNPGALEKLGFGNVAKTISGMSPSADFALKNQVNKNTLDAISRDPTLARDAASVSLTGKTETGRAQEQSDLRVSKSKEKLAENEVAQIPTLNATQLSQLKRLEQLNRDDTTRETRRGLAADWLKQNPNMNPRQIAADIANGGKISPEVAAGLLDNEGIKTAYDKLKQDSQNAAERDFISLRNSSNQQDTIERYRAATASRIYDELDNPNFTFDDVYAYINGKGQGVAPEVATKIQTAFDSMKGDKRGKLLNSYRNSLTAAQREARIAYDQARARGDKPDAIAGQLKTSAIAIQSALDQLTPLTKQGYTVEFLDQIPKTKNFLGFGGTYGIVIKDAKGQEVDPLSIGVKDDGRVQTAIEMLKSGKGNFQQLKSNKAVWDTFSPDQQKAIIEGAGIKDTSSTSIPTPKPEAKQEPTKKKEEKPKREQEVDNTDYAGLAKKYVDSGFKDYPKKRLIHPMRFSEEVKKIKDEQKAKENEKIISSIPKPKSDPDIDEKPASEVAKEMIQKHQRPAAPGKDYEVINAWIKYWQTVEARTS